MYDIFLFDYCKQSNMKDLVYFDSYDFNNLRLCHFQVDIDAIDASKYFAFSCLQIPSFQFGSITNSKAILKNILTDVNSGDVGIKIEYDDDMLINFRTALKEKIEQKTGLKNIKNCLDNTNELLVSLTLEDECPIWFRKSDNVCIRLNVTDLEQKMADNTLTCTFTALFCGGTIAIKDQTVFYEEEWKLSNMLIEQNNLAKNEIRRWVPFCKSKDTNKQQTSFLDIEQGVYNDTVVASLKNENFDAIQKQKPRLILNEMDISLILNTSS